MNSLLKARETIKNIYTSSEVYMLPALKFLLAFVLFYLINTRIGYLELMSSMFIVVILSLLCAILPLNGMVGFAMALIVLHSFGVGMEVGLFALCLYLVLFFLFFRFVPGDGIAVLLTPLSFMLNIPSVVPISLGMFGRAVSAVTSACSVVSYFFIRQLPLAAELKAADELSSLELLKEMMDEMVLDSEIILYVIVFAAVTLSVCLIRRQLTTYSWLVSSLAGTALYLVLMLCGVFFLYLEIGIPSMIFGAAVAAVVSLLISFFFVSVDYKGSRYIQFEDDEYYYFVKAVPKNKPVDKNLDAEDEDIAYFRNEDKRR